MKRCRDEFLVELTYFQLSPEHTHTTLLSRTNDVPLAMRCCPVTTCPSQLLKGILSPHRQFCLLCILMAFKAWTEQSYWILNSQQ